LPRLTSGVHKQEHQVKTQLSHILVVEEAHRLLSAAARASHEEEADPRGKAVETFSNLLAEIRAYGQGVIVADQIPSRLAPDVMKNTNLKVVHRLVAGDDREAVARTMTMNDRQALTLGTLESGIAAVFSEGDDAPLLVRFPYAKLPVGTSGDLRAAMISGWPHRSSSAMFSPLPSCHLTCQTIDALICREASAIVEAPSVSRVFSRLVQSAMERTGALDRWWEDLVAAIRSERRLRTNEELLLRCSIVRAAKALAERRGRQLSWSYQETGQFQERLTTLLLQKLMDEQNDIAVREFEDIAQRLFARDFPPYRACNEICTQTPPVCLYRFPVKEVTQPPEVSWSDALDQSRPPGEQVERVWVASRGVAYDVIEFVDEIVPDRERPGVIASSRRAALCAAQQLLAKLEHIRRSRGAS
jgi:hypothetical protein